jgi:hypothetical protein
LIAVSSFISTMFRCWMTFWSPFMGRSSTEMDVSDGRQYRRTVRRDASEIHDARNANRNDCANDY